MTGGQWMVNNSLAGRSNLNEFEAGTFKLPAYNALKGEGAINANS